MALFGNQDPTAEVQQLRDQGLSDSVIMEELSKKGYKPEQINSAIMANDSGMDMGAPEQYPPQDAPPMGAPMDPGMGPPPAEAPTADDGGMYERIEEITENLIDEKWDELIAEVKKIIDWKEKVEEMQKKLIGDVTKLKEDFSVLHKGVLGKLESYDTRMRDVGTELNAVGKVFKDVIPEFVENVKELSHITGKVKK